MWTSYWSDTWEAEQQYEGFIRYNKYLAYVNNTDSILNGDTRDCNQTVKDDKRYSKSINFNYRIYGIVLHGLETIIQLIKTLLIQTTHNIQLIQG